jgi:hypothetical protein
MKLRIGAAPSSYHLSCTRSSLTWSLPTHCSPDRLVSRNVELHNGCGRPPSLASDPLRGRWVVGDIVPEQSKQNRVQSLSVYLRHFLALPR